MDDLGSYQLPPPWSQPQTRDGFPLLLPVERGIPTSAHANEHPFLDISMGSHDDDGFGAMTTEGRVAKLKHVHQQLLQTWAMVCPEMMAEIQAVSDRIQNLTVPKSPDSELEAMAAPHNVIGSHGETRETPHRKTTKQPMTKYEFDEIHYPLHEPDIGINSIHTPSFGIAQSGVSVQSQTSIGYTSATATTTTTYTYATKQPVMSVLPTSDELFTVDDAGTCMSEETSLHGRIWVPTSHSTPLLVTGVPSSVASSCLHGALHDQNLPEWRLVGSDKPFHTSPSYWATGDGRAKNPAHLPFEVWVDQMTPVLRQAFDAGKSWALSNTGDQYMGSHQGPPVVQHCYRDGVGQDTAAVDQLQCPVSMNSETLLKSGIPLSQLGPRRSCPSGVSPVVGQSPFPVVGPRVRFGDAAPDSWKQSDAVSDSLNTGGVVSDSVKPSVSQDTSRHSDAAECRPSMLNYRPKKVAKYDGKTSWADYLVQFNIASQLNGWNDSQKAMELATSLEGTARSVLADLRPDHQLDFKSLIDKLTQRFEPEGQVGIYQSQLQNRKRKRNESIPELVQDISRLARKAYPAADEQTRSYMAISSFISALGNEPQELFVYQKEPQNLDEAGRAALSYETFQAARGKETAYVRSQQFEKTPGGPPPWARQWMTKIDELEKKLSSWSQKANNGRGRNPANSRSGNRRPGACHHCGQQGHWIRECPLWGTPGVEQPKSEEKTEPSSAVEGVEAKLDSAPTMPSEN